MNKVDTILKSFSFDPFAETDMLSFTETVDNFVEGQHFLEDAISTASKNTSKGNIGQKLIELIKKLIAWCSVQWTRLINFIKKHILRKSVKTTDQLISEMGIGRKEAYQKYGETKRIEIPSDDTSDMKVEDHVDLVFRPFQLTFGDNKKTIKFSFTGNMMKSGYRVGQGKIKGQEASIGGVIGFMTCIKLIQNRDKRDLISELIKILQAKQLTPEYRNKVDELTSWISGDNILGFGDQIKVFEFTMDELTSFQSWLNKMNDDIKLIEDPSITIDNQIGWFSVQFLNTLSGILSNIQMGMNIITLGITSANMIDASYYGSISDTKTLGIFIKKCIDAGIPSKYVAYNAYLISDRSIRGEKGDARHPIWGQTRVVFFPPNEEIIHKVALNGLGIRANYSEYKISDAFRKSGGSDLIALVTGITEDSTVIDAERIGKASMLKANMKEIQSLADKINEISDKNNIPMNITADLHYMNVGIKNGHLAALDYGMSRRTSLIGNGGI